MPYEFPSDVTENLPRAFGEAPLTGLLKNSPDDFQVIENLGYTASGEGEHAFLTIQKRGLNTQDIVKRLIQFAKVKPMSIGFAGLKDKQAITTQHFSVHLPGLSDPDWEQLNDAQCQILSAQRHHRKIRRGTLKGNQFKLILRELEGNNTQAEKRLQILREHGFPNYFGTQRFGWESSNLKRAELWFSQKLKKPKPEQKRMLVSAARSYLFNKVLSERIINNTWQTALHGDVMLLEQTNKQFLASPLDKDIIQRTNELKIHSSGPLPGKESRALQATSKAMLIENHALCDENSVNWIQALKQQNIDADRRALRVSVKDLSWKWLDAQTLEMGFNLPPGAYATMLVRELINIRQA